MSCSATKAVNRQRLGASKWTGCAAAPGSETTAPSSQSSARGPPVSVSKLAPREPSPPLSSSFIASRTGGSSGNFKSHRVSPAPCSPALGVCTFEKRSAKTEGSCSASARLRLRSASTNSRRAEAVLLPNAPRTFATPLRQTPAAALPGRFTSSRATCCWVADACSRLKRSVSGRCCMRSSTSGSGNATAVSRLLMAKITLPGSTPATSAALPVRTSLTSGGVLHMISIPKGPSAKVTSS
mmetsp:Transcript_63557/g.185829  ORF Transcript_63557/g.185829 Transcript_63557/m.185829 type:complete len:240 (+) Transcript_63557:382-1101(+)